ncbi:ATP-dependent DNA helicase PIF1-like protein [Tanacetum coccineum]
MEDVWEMQPFIPLLAIPWMMVDIPLRRIKRKDTEEGVEAIKAHRVFHCAKESNMRKVSSDVEDFKDLKKKTMMFAKAFARRQQEFLKMNELEEELSANMIFMAKMKNALFDSGKSSLLHNDTILEFELNYGLCVDNNDNQEIFHDANEYAHEIFDENHIVSENDHNESESNHNESEEKDHIIDSILVKFTHKIAKCARSFTELKMVNKINCATFKAACFAYGLQNDDKEWTHAITEASLYPELNLSDEQVRNYCLLEIQDLLNTHGKSLTDFKDLPEPNPKLLTNLDNRLLIEALAFDANKSKVEHEKLHSMRNGKNFLIQDHNRKIKIKIDDCSCYRLFRIGIASLLILAGRTTHSRFVIPLELMENSTCGILPVIPNAKRPEMNMLSTEKLIIQIKILIDGYWLWVMGNYQLKNESEDEPTWIEIPEEFLIKSWTSLIEQIVTKTYPDFTSRQTDDDYLKERAILTLRNDDANAINENMFKKLGGVPVTYNSVDEICKASRDTADQHNLYPVKFLNSLNFQGIPPPCPLLKKGTPNNDHSEYKPKSGDTGPDGLKILMIEDEDKEFKNHTRNIVFKEAFNNVS